MEAYFDLFKTFYIENMFDHEETCKILRSGILNENLFRCYKSSGFVDFKLRKESQD